MAFWDETGFGDRAKIQFWLRLFYVSLGKLHHFSVLYFPYIQDGETKSGPHIIRRSEEMMHVNYIQQIVQRC